ncbi:hypothetical protein C2G38_2202833 [Gigaspora rosea]|uniref:Uncharacterized protein n=1 Tax=Gigaspora rosea TaxID=44941 RepID=A0A397UVX7_9GLOM|nr:hypothetical protein C2G38_2202833 [Gigaspora rosea]
MCTEESHPILEYSEVKPLDENPPNDEQLPEVLEFALEVVENIIKNDHEEDLEEIKYIPSFIKQRIRPTVEEVLDTYYVPDEPKKKSPQDVALGLGIDLKPLQTLLSKSPNIYPKFVEPANVDKMDESKELEILGNWQQKEMETKTDEHKTYDYCQKLVKVAENQMHQIKEKKKKNVPVEFEEVVDGKLKLILKEKAFNRNYGLGVKEDECKTSNGHLMSAESGDTNRTFMVGNCYLNGKNTNGPSHLRKKDFLEKKLEEAAELWIKKVTELRKMIKRDRENELEETKVYHHNINFEKPLDDLDKALEIKPIDTSALEKEENKLLKRADRDILTEKYESLEDNHKQEDICATGVILIVKNEVKKKEKEKTKWNIPNKPMSQILTNKLVPRFSLRSQRRSHTELNPKG